MQITDPLGLIKAESIEQVAKLAGIATPDRVEACRRTRHFVYYLLSFPDEAQQPMELQLELVTPLQGTAIFTELAAHKVLEANFSYPSIGTYQLVPAGLFGRPAALTAAQRGKTGDAWIRDDPSVFPLVAGEIGRLLGVLADTPVPRFGMRGDDGRFVSRVQSWREEWGCYVRALHRSVVIGGIGLGSLTAEIHRRIIEDLEALDTTDMCALAHRRLAPSQVFLELDGAGARVTGVVDWGRSVVGDPLLEWGYLATLPPAPLKALLSEYWGVDYQSEDAQARIRVYHRTSVLEHLRELQQLILQVSDGSALLRLEEARVHAERALAGDYLATLFEEVATADTEISARIVVEPARSALRGALYLLHSDPPMAAVDGERLVAALGAALCADDAEDAGVKEVGLAVSRRLVQVSARLGLGWYAPDEMADGWQQELVDLVLDRVASGDGQRLLALACLAFGLEAMERLGFETLSSAVCSNFEVICRSMVERDVLARAVTPEVVVSNALLGLGALGLLKARGFVQEGPMLDSLRERLQEALTDGWERANPLQMPVWSPLPDDSSLHSYILAARELAPVEQLSRPAIVLAMRHAGEVTLPVPGDQLLSGTRI